MYVQVDVIHNHATFLINAFRNNNHPADALGFTFDQNLIKTNATSKLKVKNLVNSVFKVIYSQNKSPLI